VKALPSLIGSAPFIGVPQHLTLYTRHLLAFEAFYWVLLRVLHDVRLAFVPSTFVQQLALGYGLEVLVGFITQGLSCAYDSFIVELLPAVKDRTSVVLQLDGIIYLEEDESLEAFLACVMSITNLLSF